MVMVDVFVSSPKDCSKWFTLYLVFPENLFYRTISQFTFEAFCQYSVN